MVLSDPSTMREPSLTTRPPMISGIDLHGDFDGLAAGQIGERPLQGLDMLVFQRLAATVTSARMRPLARSSSL